MGTALTKAFGRRPILTFVGALILAQSMLKHGVARRFAFRILAIPGAGGQHVQDQRIERGEAEGFDPTLLRVGFAIMLMLAYGASVGGRITPVGSPPNLTGRELSSRPPVRRSRSRTGWRWRSRCAR